MQKFIFQIKIEQIVIMCLVVGGVRKKSDASTSKKTHKDPEQGLLLLVFFITGFHIHSITRARQ